MTIDIEQLKAAIEAGTPGPWTGCNMTHAEGRPMTPDELGEYVSNSVMMGSTEKFLFVSGVHADGTPCDVCLTGNGPRGDANTRLISQAPDLAAEVIRQADRIAALEAKIAEAYDEGATDLLTCISENKYVNIGDKRRAAALCDAMPNPYREAQSCSAL